MKRDPLSATFGALADPTRRAMLSRLGQGEASVTDLAKPFRMSQPAISKHLKVLEQAGLVSRSRQAQWRPCRLESRPLQEATAWMEQCRKDWDTRLDQLENYVQKLQKASNREGKKHA
jgi:DNA-binding transcriptional ArsR family regulator